MRRKIIALMVCLSIVSVTSGCGTATYNEIYGFEDDDKASVDETEETASDETESAEVETEAVADTDYDEDGIFYMSFEKIDDMTISDICNKDIVIDVTPDFNPDDYDFISDYSESDENENIVAFSIPKCSGEIKVEPKSNQLSLSAMNTANNQYVYASGGTVDEAILSFAEDKTTIKGENFNFVMQVEAYDKNENQVIPYTSDFEYIYATVEGESVEDVTLQQKNGVLHLTSDNAIKDIVVTVYIGATYEQFEYDDTDDLSIDLTEFSHVNTIEKKD